MDGECKDSLVLLTGGLSLPFLFANITHYLPIQISNFLIHISQ